MKIAVVTCYRQPNYVRAVTLRQAVQDNPQHELLVIRNKRTSLLRYPEVLLKLIWVRLRHQPDTYLLTFRAYEIFPFACLLTWPRTLIYDEFINPLEWLQEDRKEWWAKLIPQSLLTWFYRLLLRRCALILADTPAHATYSETMFQLPGARFRGLPVGADEKVFFNPGLPKNKEFTVFFYATMLPLHGLDVILEAIEKLKDYPIKFVFSGGDNKTVATVAASKQRGAHIEHHKWIAYDKLREYAARAHLTLGGPFGNTTQANMVITGKTYQFLACGTAVMVGQTKENQMLKDQQNSLVVPLGDARALAHKIIWAYKHQNRLPAIAAAGKKLYNEQFSSTAIARQLASLLGELE